jgi:hypothetical protein
MNAMHEGWCARMSDMNMAPATTWLEAAQLGWSHVTGMIMVALVAGSCQSLTVTIAGEDRQWHTAPWSCESCTDTCFQGVWVKLHVKDCTCNRLAALIESPSAGVKY